MPLNLELGMSASSSSGAQAGLGDTNYSRGFKIKTEQLVILVVAVLLALVLLKRK